MPKSNAERPSSRNGIAIVPPQTTDDSTDDPIDLTGSLKHVGGSTSDHWNGRIANDTALALWTANSDAETRDVKHKAAVAGLIGIAPRDELEGMLAAQLIAAHSAAMECYRRAMIGDQPFEAWRESLSQANKLSRSFAALLDALNRHRGKGQQKVTVEHVHVHAGGQAVVGMVQRPKTLAPGGGDRSKVEEQPHAKQIAHAFEPALPGPDPNRDAVPVPCPDERALPNARGQRIRRANGKP